MRILIADDHPIFRRGLRRVLEDYGHEVVAECDHGKAVMSRVEALHPDLILMDLQMPVQDGVTTLRMLKGQPPCIVLTVSDDDADLQEAMEAGASGYLLKSTEAAKLAGMLEAVASGYRVMPTQLSCSDGKAESDAPNLSARQQEVLDRLIKGLTFKEIAQELGISQHTVRTYQERLLEKFGVHSRAELIFSASRKPDAASAASASPLAVKEASEAQITRAERWAASGR